MKRTVSRKTLKTRWPKTSYKLLGNAEKMHCFYFIFCFVGLLQLFISLLFLKFGAESKVQVLDEWRLWCRAAWSGYNFLLFGGRAHKTRLTLAAGEYKALHDNNTTNV